MSTCKFSVELLLEEYSKFKYRLEFYELMVAMLITFSQLHTIIKGDSDIINIELVKIRSVNEGNVIFK